MMNNQTKEGKTTFLGDLIFIIIRVLTIYLAMTLLTGNQIKKFEKINDKFGVSEDNLIPSNKAAYIADLSLLNDTTHSKPIIDYIYLNDDSIKINKMVNLAVLEDKNCISRTLYLEINSIAQNQDALLDEFESLDSSKLNKIYWNNYIENLRNNNDYRTLRIEITKLDICN
jgi:hypothetical protein